jgi:predicted nucleic-acid-binding protein
MSADLKSLDTSVVLRLLVGEPATQFQIAIQFLTDQLSKKIEVFVGNQVLSEAYFALQYYYKIPKAEALEMLHGFTTGSGITTTKVAEDVLALSNLASAKPGFVDRLIHGESLSTGHTLVTFEKAARKLSDTQVLS